ncbi:hypothetical protein BKA67DRAFT_352219 [Truncatella angustata]|uniref:DUF7908 domain-containing protein n=1 Tax=Truncatella angustata TaxID=152316 RepID=A0A9P8UHN5_9PEZI|nr:uncharacterized protein BKA67DRAFT_352219 [Truncatella angustata]KAH6652288.1 hypothetical protein BKA67DRAFT_352219 [Truncatella angustata]
MRALAALSLYVAPLVLGAQLPNPQYRDVFRAIKRGEEAAGQCTVRTVTYIAVYDPSTTAIDPYETGGYNAAPLPGHETDYPGGLYPVSSHNAYPNPEEPCVTYTTLRPVTRTTTLTTTTAIPTTIILNTTDTVTSLVTSTFTTVSTFTTSVLETLTATVTSTATTSSIFTTTAATSFNILSVRLAATATAAPVRRELSSRHKRQIDGIPQGFLGSALNPNPNVCSNAVLVEFLNGELFAAGQSISTDLNVPFLDLTRPVEGSITTSFSIGSDILVWANAAFFGGFARFCQVQNGTVYALFTELDAPAACIPADLVVYSGEFLCFRHGQ